VRLRKPVDKDLSNGAPPRPNPVSTSALAPTSCASATSNFISAMPRATVVKREVETEQPFSNGPMASAGPALLSSALPEPRAGGVRCIASSGSIVPMTTANTPAASTTPNSIFEDPYAFPTSPTRSTLHDISNLIVTHPLQAPNNLFSTNNNNNNSSSISNSINSNSSSSSSNSNITHNHEHNNHLEGIQRYDELNPSLPHRPKNEEYGVGVGVDSRAVVRPKRPASVLKEDFWSGPLPAELPTHATTGGYPYLYDGRSADFPDWGTPPSVGIARISRFLSANNHV
jgi:hypothetical protein